MFDKEKLLSVFDQTVKTGTDPVRTTRGKLGAGVGAAAGLGADGVVDGAELTIDLPQPRSPSERDAVASCLAAGMRSIDEFVMPPILAGAVRAGRPAAAGRGRPPSTCCCRGRGATPPCGAPCSASLALALAGWLRRRLRRPDAGIVPLLRLLRPPPSASAPCSSRSATRPAPPCRSPWSCSAPAACSCCWRRRSSWPPPSSSTPAPSSSPSCSSSCSPSRKGRPTPTPARASRCWPPSSASSCSGRCSTSFSSLRNHEIDRRRPVLSDLLHNTPTRDRRQMTMRDGRSATSIEQIRSRFRGDLQGDGSAEIGKRGPTTDAARRLAGATASNRIADRSGWSRLPGRRAPRRRPWSRRRRCQTARPPSCRRSQQHGWPQPTAATGAGQHLSAYSGPPPDLPADQVRTDADGRPPYCRPRTPPTSAGRCSPTTCCPSSWAASCCWSPPSAPSPSPSAARRRRGA